MFTEYEKKNWGGSKWIVNKIYAPRIFFPGKNLQKYLFSWEMITLVGARWRNSTASGTTSTPGENTHT